jgi:hypothetical protein
VRDTQRPAERTKLELSSLVESVIDETAETGGDATVDRTEKTIIEGDPVALKRLVSNLVDNALKYGVRARGRVFAEEGMAIIEVDDDGPGIPPASWSGCSSPSIAASPLATARPVASVLAWRSSAPWPAPTAATSSWPTAPVAACEPACSPARLDLRLNTAETDAIVAAPQGRQVG